MEVSKFGFVGMNMSNRYKLGEVCTFNPKDIIDDMAMQVSFGPMQNLCTSLQNPAKARIFIYFQGVRNSDKNFIHLPRQTTP